MAVRSLKLFAQCRKIFIITSAAVWRDLVDFDEEGIIWLPEDKILQGVTLQDMREYFKLRLGKAERAGWYYQQFLKMAVSCKPEVGANYLVWEADTIMLRRLDFFDERWNTYFTPSGEHHQPYFEITERLLEFGRQVNHSFISEHMMIDKKLMIDLLDNLSKGSTEDGHWVFNVLDEISDLNLAGSGFSEYETYGNFFALTRREKMSVRTLKRARSGTVAFGKKPTSEDLFLLMLTGYAASSFEVWQQVAPQLRWRARLASHFASMVPRLRRKLTGSGGRRFDFALRITGNGVSTEAPRPEEAVR
jgi:hypothetical protein